VDSSLTSPAADTLGGTPELIVPKRRRRPLAVVGLVLTAFLLTGCTIPTFGEYKGSTTQARSELHLWQGFFIAGLIVGGFVLLLILWTLFRYRRTSDELPKQTQYHTLTEVIYTVAPILIVIGLFIPTVLSENTVDASPLSKDPGANITVKAFQWGWEFDYPGGVKIIGQTTQAPTMMLPAGVDAHITLSSLDVLHGFYVPQFNFSRYASPGYKTYFDFDVLHPGVYRGQCTQLCGLYHSLMFFNVKAVSQSDFDSWLAGQQAFVKAHPKSVPQLPGSVHSTPSSGGNLGGDLYGD
jgi:cytochrome c oxidase subunit 2